MTKTSKLLKRMWVVAVSVIAITLMSVAVSFATEAQETAVGNTQGQAAIGEETAVVEEAAVPEAAILAEEVGVPSAHINLNITDTSVPLYCHHSLKVDGVEKKEETFLLNPSDGITFENPYFLEDPNYYAFTYGANVDIDWYYDSNNDEKFNIWHTIDNQSFDLLFDEPIISEDKSTITIPIIRPNKFIVVVYLRSEDGDPVGADYEVPYYTADGSLYKTATTDDGVATFELDRDHALGYVYDFDASKNLSYFNSTAQYYPKNNLNGEEVAVCVLYCELAEPQVSLSGNEHHSNFTYAYSFAYDNVKFYDLCFSVKELVVYFTSLMPPMSYGLNANDDSDVYKLNVEGDGTLSLDISDLIPPTEDLSIGLSFKPVAEAGYSFDNWNVMGSTYLPNSKITIDTSDFKKGDVVDMQTNYKLVETGEGTEIAQTSDATPLAAGVVAAFAVIAGLSLLALRKQH